MTDVPRHCYGPGCVRSARFGSKYCSDQCGIALATNRIYQVLPQRIQEWALSPSMAEEKNIKGFLFVQIFLFYNNKIVCFFFVALDQVRKQQMEVKQILQELDKRHKELDLIIERAKNATIDPSQENDTEDESETTMYCITCGHEIHSRTAIKHMEKCFNKYESQASFGSIFKTRIEG